MPPAVRHLFAEQVYDLPAVITTDPLQDAKPTPLLMLSPDRTVLLYNEAAEQLCGWTAEEVAGQVKCYSLLGCHDANGGLLCHGRCALRDGALRNTSEHQAHYVITLKDVSLASLSLSDFLFA